MFIENIFDQSPWFFLAGAVLAFFSLEAAYHYRRAWSVPALVGYATIAGWYLIEPIYLPELFVRFAPGTLDEACLQVAWFTVCLRISIGVFSRIALRNTGAASTAIAAVPADKFLYVNIAVWLLLVSIGIYRMNGDIFHALFPLESRAAGNMWSRDAGAAAGPYGFLVSLGGYFYTLVCASFGMLLPFIKRSHVRALAVFLILLSWPYFLLQGARNAFLAVFLPSFASYVLFSSHRLITKIIVGAVLFELVNIWFLFVIEYRNVGFEALLNGETNDTVASNEKHLGLNMMSELCYINSFYDLGVLHLEYGMRYLAELANVIPRAIWPSKPLIGIDYAVLRGFGGGASDIGVYAAISTGIVGQGFMDFGPVFGPAVGATLFGLWLSILCRFRRQQGSVLRLTLFLLGLGLTFNLGRGMTLLVLWPMVFAYVIVRLLERRRKPRLARQRTARPIGVRLPPARAKLTQRQ